MVELQNEGYEVVIIDDLSNSSIESLFPRVEFFDNMLKMAFIQMHINFGGSDAFMSKHLLNGPKVCTVFK